MLCYITCIMCHNMLCDKTGVMLCYITCVMSYYVI